MRLWRTLLVSFLKGAALVSGGLTAALLAVTVSGTISSFSSGDLISASTINANFSALKTAIEGVPDHDAVRVRTSVNQNFTSTALNAFSFGTEEYDTNNMFTATDSRIYIQTAGKYLVLGTVDCGANAAGLRIARFYKNGVALDDFARNANSITVTHLNPAGVYEFAAGDFIELYAEQHSGATLGCAGQFSVTKLSN